MRRKSSMRSQTSLPMERSSSMGVPSPTPVLKHQLIEYPTSPQSSVGEEIKLYAHSNHPLTEVTIAELFTCDGCKEYGAGKRLACQQCEVQLHDFCAVSPPVLRNHPLHGQHQLVFHSKPKSGKGAISWPRCDVCGKSTKGFTFRCRACSFQMHPCCAKLTTEINFPTHHHPLTLLPAINTASPANNGVNCGQCNKKRSGRIYRCTVCEYHLHAVCAKISINGLQANGITPHKKPSKLGTAGRLASQVVKEFIEGVMEGLGESVGQFIIQTIVSGRRISRRRVQD